MNGRRLSAWRLAAPMLLSGLSLAGCVTNGDDFRSDTSWVKEGQTKQTDVRRLLGEPFSVGNSAGKPTWKYGFYRYRLFGKSFQKELKFYWNPDGTLSTYSFDSSFPDDIGKSTGGGKSANGKDQQPDY